MQATHKIAVNIDPAAKGVAALAPIDLEVKVAIEAQGTLVIGVDVQLKPQQIQPVVGKVEHGQHQQAPDPFTLVSVVNRECEDRRVPLAILANL
jgi:hypothetical protein